MSIICMDQFGTGLQKIEVIVLSALRVVYSKKFFAEAVVKNHWMGVRVDFC